MSDLAQARAPTLVILCMQKLSGRDTIYSWLLRKALTLCKGSTLDATGKNLCRASSVACATSSGKALWPASAPGITIIGFSSTASKSTLWRHSCATHACAAATGPL